MKVFKIIGFISFLSGIFLLIYWQSEEKGFRKWGISFRTATIIAASLIGVNDFGADSGEAATKLNNDSPFPTVEFLNKLSELTNEDYIYLLDAIETMLKRKAVHVWGLIMNPKRIERMVGRLNFFYPLYPSRTELF